MSSNDFGKKCDCGHYKHDHVWIQTSVSKLGFLEWGFFRTFQEGRGKCKKCTCLKYFVPSFFHPGSDVKYTLRVLKRTEPRCTRCGTLSSNHEGIDHEFQGNKDMSPI